MYNTFSIETLSTKFYPDGYRGNNNQNSNFQNSKIQDVLRICILVIWNCLGFR